MSGGILDNGDKVIESAEEHILTSKGALVSFRYSLDNMKDSIIGLLDIYDRLESNINKLEEDIRIESVSLAAYKVMVMGGSDDGNTNR